MSCEVAVKVDVDTLKGYLEGVPRLLDIFGKRGLRASIFFSMGPDNSGKAIRRIFRKGFLAKMWRTRAPSAYGLKTLLYGTLLKAPMIVRSNPDVLRRAADEGHDCGIHCWDHVLWQDGLPRMTRGEIRAELDRAAELFAQVAKMPPKSCAAPGWQVTPDSLAVQDELGFDYCSDTRGTAPFFPRMNGVPFKTPQIPSTLPTLDELWGSGAPPLADVQSVNDKYLDLLEPGLNVHTIHAEMEGGGRSDVFVRFLDCCLEGETAFPTLAEVAARIKNSPEAENADIEMTEIPGRSGRVAGQKRLYSELK